jgi:hypothetical protein
VEYKKKATMKNKAGNPLPKQAHMELAIRQNLDLNLGDVLYYINTGSSKSHGDLKTVDKVKMTKKEKEAYFAANGELPRIEKIVELNCKLIDPMVVERDFEAIKELEMLKKSLTVLGEDNENVVSIKTRMDEINNSLYTDEYNVARYLEAFNKKVKPLLVCFNPEIRDKILLDIVKTKDKTTKLTTEKLKQRTIFTKGECDLVSGMPFKEKDQDSYEELMTMEDKEIKFWDKVNKVPNYMEVEEWEAIRADYHVRMAIIKAEGVKYEKEKLEDIIKRLELSDLNDISTKRVLPVEIVLLVDVIEDDNFTMVSRKWNEPLGSLFDIFKYEQKAIERDKYYKLIGNENDDNKFEAWLDYIAEQKILTGETITLESNGLVEDAERLVESFKEQAKLIIPNQEPVKKKKVYLENEDDDDELEMEEDEDGNLTRVDELIILDDEFDDTFGDKPDDYVLDVLTKKIEENDGWPF